MWLARRRARQLRLKSACYERLAQASAEQEHGGDPDVSEGGQADSDSDFDSSGSDSTSSSSDQ